jgi:hypothetical protein
MIDRNALEFTHDLKRRYRAGLPAAAPVQNDRALRPEEVVNDDLDLGPYEHPLVLSTVASRDPFMPAGLAAAVRLMARKPEPATLIHYATTIGDLAQHGEVRNGIALGVRSNFAPEIIRHLRRMTLDRASEAKQGAIQQLTTLVRTIGRGEMVPDSVPADLLRLSYESDLKPHLFEHMILGALESPNVRARVKLALIEGVHLFPQKLRFSIATSIQGLAKHPEFEYLRRELAWSLAKHNGEPAPAIMAVKRRTTPAAPNRPRPLQ